MEQLFVGSGVVFVLWGVYYLLGRWRERGGGFGAGPGSGGRRSGGDVGERRSGSELEQLFDDYDRERRQRGR